ncbi:unnamed protein product [Spirodela intermedia]|uniref:Uncharacterized protein n=1 Tax=Spirodela intermedia TaxID=51605 RepID=A0A7I8JLQ3_SPIIN|nr:unnamed protein product [Spirodela intermedia]CAA6670745.1 unnamed protein product [Spirodela intermedia]
MGIPGDGEGQPSSWEFRSEKRNSGRTASTTGVRFPLKMKTPIGVSDLTRPTTVNPLANVYQQQARPAIPYGSPVPNPSHPPPNSGARLMALLAPPMISAGVPQTTQARLPSGKQPHGRHINGGDRFVYDVDVRESPPPPQLEAGNIRVLNINTALRSLLRGHTQRVTDMAFFAEDVHLLASASVDGRVFVWKINEGPDKDDKPQITGKIIVAIQIVSDGESFHPQVCWHCHKQEILVVGIGNRLLKIDMTKVGKGEVFSEEDEPLQCHVDKLIDGVQLIGKHDQEVTDLSMSQWMMTRLASASKDGTVSTPLVTLRPHDGHLSTGPLNREVKIWASANQEGWLLPSDCESWLCMQTLELRSCTETRVEDAFFNQVVVLPQASLILLANAKKNVIYALHIDYGSNPLSTRMDYIAEFSVKMPILSITATSDCYADGKHVIQVYCVQTQAIQQYALDLSQCLPPPWRMWATSDSFASATVGITANEDPSGNSTQNFSIPLNTSETSPAVKYSLTSDSPDNSSLLEITALKTENRPNSERGSSLDNVIDQSVARQSIERGLEVGALNLPDAPLDDSSVKRESKPGPSDITVVPNLPSFPMGTKVTHLVTPSEILSKAVSSTESNVIPELNGTQTRIPEVSSNLVTETAEVEVKVIGESGSSVYREPDSQREPQIQILEDQSKSLSSQFTESNSDIVRDDIFNVAEVREKTESKAASNVWTIIPSQTPFDSSDSFNEQGSNFSTADAGFPQALSNIQAMLSQVMAMQNQMNAVISLPVTKEGKRVEVALGRCIEKAIKANNDVLWARFQEEIAKREKLEKDRMQQMTSSISNSLNKDLPAIIEKVVKKENSSVGPNLARSISPALEKAISSAIADSFQKGVGDKAVNQLEKSVNSKLEVAVARQVQGQFQTSVKQYLQDGMRCCLEASIIPSFELACKAMFEQIDAGFHKGMVEHTTTVQQQLEAAHTPLALSLRDAVNSALAVTQALSNEIADGNPKSLDSIAAQQANGPLGGLHEMLTRLITERKFDEAFTMALQRSDVTIVSWLCSQVDLQGICSMSPLPLSQGVLLSLLQQLACDLAKDTTQKLAWMTQVAVAINPSDPMIALHVRPIFDQVYQILAHQRSLPTTTAADSNSIRLMLHVINSVLTGFK